MRNSDCAETLYDVHPENPYQCAVVEVWALLDHAAQRFLNPMVFPEKRTIDAAGKIDQLDNQAALDLVLVTS